MMKKILFIYFRYLQHMYSDIYNAVSRFALRALDLVIGGIGLFVDEKIGYNFCPFLKNLGCFDVPIHNVTIERLSYLVCVVRS